IGIVIGRFLLQSIFKKQEQAAQEKAERIIKQAEQQAEHHKKQRNLEAKEKFLQLKGEHEKEVSQRNSAVAQKENTIRQKEQTMNQKLESLNREKQDLDNKSKKLDHLIELNERKTEEADQLKNQHIKQLETIAGLSAQEAKEQLVNSLREEARSEAIMQIKDIVDEAKLTASKEAKKVVIQTIQRTATESAIENTVSIFNIENDEIKGRIIGREGRNIRALEAATGVEIIVDDTPEAIILSGFDPVRREIARLSLH